MRYPLDRRAFLGTSAVTGTVLAAGLTGEPAAAAAAPSAPAIGLPPVRIHKVFAGRSGDSYLTRPTEEVARLEKYFRDLETRLGDVRFVGGDHVPPTRLETITAKLKTADAVLLIHLSGHGGDAPVLGKIVDVGLPTAVFSQPFSGHGWMYFPQWHKMGRKVALLPTSDWKELDTMAGLLRAAAWMRQSRVLVVGGPLGTAAACSAEKVKARLGADVVTIPNSRVMDVYRSIDARAAEAEAQEYWITPAKKVVEPGRQEIISSARLYLAVKKLLAEEKAQAITSKHCMGDPRGCLTFSKLNDEGLVGACEGDIDSTLTMLLFAYAFRVPGFISDPVVDTAKNALIHFHCTSATKLDGPCGKRMPFTIRTQTDSRGGVALEVENRVGQPVTCAKLVNLDTLLYCTGKILETSTNPLGCRTQFTQSVPSARRLFLNWGGDVIKGDVMTLLHRVVFYGDYRKQLENLGDLMGFKVLEEGGAA